MNDLDRKLREAKQASLEVAKLSANEKEALLLAFAKNLEKHKQEIFKANTLDVSQTKAKDATNAFIDRLSLSEESFAGMISQLETVAHLPDVLDEIIENRTLANGMRLKKLRFPLGLIAMIYESRPNVTIDAAGLCLKAGNAVILKGGSEAANTNRILVRCIHEILTDLQLPKAAVTLLENASHKDVDEMLTRNDLIDVVVPRGSYALTTTVAKKSRIPILYHSSGGARMYVDQSANIQQALEICVNAKTNRTGVCNALDMVLVHKNVAGAFLKKLDSLLNAKGFEVRADTTAKKYMQHAKEAHEKDFSTEFLDSILAVKVVSNSDEAINFIKLYTHGHTEILAAKDATLIDKFIHEIDAAGIMINCSSRLHDGGEFEMGAEMGTATGKLHARGPVGVRELTTYKWIAFGDGQVKSNDMIHEKIAIIGSGNMGQAIARGLIDKKIVNPTKLRLTNSQTNDNKEAASEAAIIILAVKPQLKASVLEEIKQIIKDQLIISIMAGITIDIIQQSLGKKTAVIRVMPNLAAKVGKSMSVWIKSDEVTNAQAEKAKLILQSIGQQLELQKETQIDKATAISGSGPAYFFYLTEIIEDAATKFGFSQEEARLLSEQTLFGSAELVSSSKDSAKRLRYAVTSKGGTTEAAIGVFKNEKLPIPVINGITAAYKRAKQLGKVKKI